MGAGSWHSLRWPSWRTWLETGLQRLQRISDTTPAQRVRLIRWGLLAVGGLILFFTASILWRAMLMGAAGAGLALFLQQLVDPTPLFWTVPWEAMQLLLSRRVRLNHLWLHRTQGLIHDSDWRQARLDGFATREGFFLTGIALNGMEAQWNAELAWRGVALESATKRSTKGGCKTARFLLTLWFLAGGLLILTAWRGFDLPSALFLGVICGATGHALAGPVEKMLGSLAASAGRRQEEARPYRIEVEQAELPKLPWFKGARGFWVRPLDLEPRELGGDL